MKNIKKLTLFLLVLVLTFIAYSYFDKSEIEDESAKVLIKSDENRLKTIDANIDLTQDDSSISIIQKDDNNDLVKYKVEEWLIGRGYIEMANVDGKFQEVPLDYHGYDDASLKSIADSGDKIAQMLYAERLMKSGVYDSARHYAYKSVINGYTKPIKDLVAINMHRFSQELSAANQKTAKSFYIEAMAWFEVAAIRKDPFLLQSKDVYKHYGKNLSLDKTDQEKIKKKGLALYNQLVSDRLDAGFDEFDNAFPEQ